MGYFQVWYDPRVVNYDRKMFIRLATGDKSHLVHRGADSSGRRCRAKPFRFRSNRRPTPSASSGDYFPEVEMAI